MSPRSALRTVWLCVVVANLVLSLGCHLLFGGFEEQTGAPPGSSGATGACNKGGSKCNDEFLLTCAADQSAWVKSATCASKDQCDSGSGRCLICPQANTLRCNGARREACSPDRTEWLLKDDCDSAELCSPSGCGPCPTPGELQCTTNSGSDAGAIRQCDPITKTWVVVAACPNDEVCMATLNTARSNPVQWDKTCNGKCTPGAFKCDGSTLYRCPESGLDWMAVAPCATPGLCALTMAKIANMPDLGASLEQCDPGCGTPGQPRCENGSALQRCSADQTSWETVMQCPAGLQCSTQGEGACVVCTPGEFQCNGALLEQCTDERLWKQLSDCRTPALCQVQADTTTGKSQGSCATPSCTRAGEGVCGTDTDPKTPGATWWECNADLNGFIKGDTCATAALCIAADKKCNTPVCEPGQRRCNPESALAVQSCNAGRTGWELVTTCKAGEFCDAKDAVQPCKTECPAALFCNDRFLQTCSAVSGVVQKAECRTKELCDCGVSGTCPLGNAPDGCGVTVCGATLPNFRCVANGANASLQACKPGRDGWAAGVNCGASNLCYAGEPPYYTGGYCATCPVAGEVACNGSATQTCATDRKSWTGQQTCSYGCRDNASTDYCTACFAAERRCSGSQLLACSTDQKTLTLQENCQYGCVNSGNTDYCGTCGVNEKRCSGSAPGSTLQTCSTDQKSLVAGAACANGCIDSGVADYCSDCRVGESQCSGAGVRTCGADGRWGVVSACANGCVDSGVADYCGGCSQGELRCSGSTLQQCSADQTTLTTLETCANGCINSGTADYCAACAAGESRCSGASSIQQCSADRRTLSAATACANGCIESGTADYCAVCSVGELRCNLSTLQICSPDQKSLSNSQSCTNGCFDGGAADYCGECQPGATRCTGTGTGTQTCGTNGRWGAASACANGCFGTSPSAYCGVCQPGVDTQCTGSAVQTCTTAGQWSATTSVCPRGCVNSGTSDFCADCNTGDSSCVGSNLQVCSGGRYVDQMACTLGCFGSSPTAACGACSSGETRCSGAVLEQCTSGQWAASMTCANGCFGAAPSAACGVCPVGGAECVSSSSRRTCMDGRWTAAAACPNNVCVGTSCAQCSPGATACDGSTQQQVCSAAGTWGPSVDCPNEACVNDACAECMPGAAECTTDGRRVCSATGSWGTAVACESGPCIGTVCAACTPDATECTDASRQRVCDASGRWGATAMCPSGACVGVACAACVPGTSECVGTTVRTCSPQGQWMPASACEYGCMDNGTADACRTCPIGASECLGASDSRRVCDDGTWTTSQCMHGCFESGDADYCGACSEGMRTCVDTTTYQLCGTDGQWVTPATSCGEQVCLNGSCVACTPGTISCFDTMNRQTCSASGAWDPEPCAEGMSCSDGVCQ